MYILMYSYNNSAKLTRKSKEYTLYISVSDIYGQTSNMADKELGQFPTYSYRKPMIRTQIKTALWDVASCHLLVPGAQQH